MAEVRPEMVETAVRFLQHDRVRDSSVAKQTAFLERKGLTPLEIARALEVSASQPEGGTAIAGEDPGRTRVAPTSWLGLLGTGVAIGGATFLGYKAAERLIQPWLATNSPDDPESATVGSGAEATLHSLHTELAGLRAGVEEQASAMQALAAALEARAEEELQQQSRLAAQLDALAAGRVDGLAGVKEDVAALKALLLAPRTFPKASPSPSLPAWQRQMSASLAEEAEESPVEDEEAATPPGAGAVAVAQACGGGDLGAIATAAIPASSPARPGPTAPRPSAAEG